MNDHQDNVQQRLARAYAVMEGRGDDFDACRKDPFREETEGRYEGYMSEAGTMLEDAGLKSIMLMTPTEVARLVAGDGSRA